MPIWWWPISCCFQYGLCPSNQVAFVDTNTNMAQSCVVGQPTSCPPGYSCQVSSTNQGLCCGQAGQCPPGSIPYTDPSGRLHSCSPSLPSGCLRPSVCQAAVGGQPGQFLCCITSTPTGQCPSGFILQNNQPVPCNPSAPMSCAPGGSCLPSPTQPSSFFCCQPSGGSMPVDSEQCPSGYRPQGGATQPCSPTVISSCSPGSQCLQSPSRPSLFYCCTLLGVEASQCPPNYSLQDGVLTQCSMSTPSCKPNASCLQSPSNPSLFICCIQSSAQLSPCPQGFSLQNNLAINCNPTSPSVCQVGSSCLQSNADANVFICCTPSSSAAEPALQCPVGFSRENNQLTRCEPATLSPCHISSFCLPSVGGISPTHICCSSNERATSNFLQCPINYVNQDGAPVQCNPQNPTAKCLPSATCLASLEQPTIFICCIPSTPPSGQCPPGYSLQNNIVAQCSPSFPTCLAGSKCLASAVNPSFFLCCRPSSAAEPLQCPAGLSYPAPTPQTCTPGATAVVCPLNSQCMQSQNQPNVFVCCLAGGVSGRLQCPGSGQASTSGSTFTFCTLGATPTTCPSGYACQPATNAAGISICCTSGGLPPTCPNGAASVPMSGTPGHFVYCTSINPTCPVGATCQTATNMLNTYVCCTPLGTSTAYACPHDFTPLVDPTGLVTFCSANGGSCPPPSSCVQAANNPQFFICCQPFGQSAAQCPTSGSTPLYVAGIVQTCAGPTAACPQIGYTCQESSSNRQYICCSTGPPGGVQCANGQQIYQPGSISFFCNPTLSQCPAQYDCLPSSLPGQNVCCSRSGTALQCVSGRQPFPNSQTPQICSPQTSICPPGTTCEQSTIPTQHICCASSGAMSKCPANATPFMEGLSPRRCTGPSDLSCPPPYSCAPSDQPNVYICCQFISGTPPGGTTSGAALRCFSGAPAFIPPGSTQPQTCTLVAQTCPPGFSCQASTVQSVTVCCGAAHESGLSCPDGSPALIRGTSPIICSNPIESCPEKFVCLPTQSSPGVRICCATPSAGAGVADGRPQRNLEVCGPGQQPYFLNNQPQMCQIGNQQSCTEGYICQQGPAGIYYCCQGPRCPNGVTLLETNGHPKFCNPASASCPLGSHCQQSINLPGNFICCMTSVSQSPTLSRCIGRNTYILPTGRPQMCSNVGPNVCPPGYECSSFTTTNEMVCCSLSTPMDSGSTPTCPQGDPYRDPLTRQYHYCSNTNFACPEGFVCKQVANDPGQYICCSGRTTCQKSWTPFVDRFTNLPLQCSPFDKNSCLSAGPLYKCQQSTKPGEYLCCMESVAAMRNTLKNGLDYENETVDYDWTGSSAAPSISLSRFHFRNGNG